MSILVIEPPYHAKNLAFHQPLIDLGLDLTRLNNCQAVNSVKIGGILVIGDAIRDDTRSAHWDVKDVRILDKALSKDLPILATGMGMNVLNELFGGQSASAVDGHIEFDDECKAISIKHSIYVSPGSKSAAILGLGGFFNVNSQHFLGLTESDRAKALLASAYAVEDGVVEGLESTQHDWVIGFQSNIELLMEGPRSFKNIFLGLKERSESCDESKILGSLDISL